MFNEKVYAIAKSEKHYPALFDIKTEKGTDGWVIYTRSNDEISKLDYFGFDPDEKERFVEKLRTRMSVGQTIC